MTRFTAAVFVLALLGVSACGDDEQPEPAIEVPAWAKVATEQIAEAKKHGVPVAFENDMGMRFVLIPAGTFLMGSPEEGSPFEVSHEVTITKPFYMQITEVINQQYRRFRADHHPWKDLRQSCNGDTHPVADVSWEDALALVTWLGQQDRKHGYRLPTEAEWEYACRAGTTTAYWSGDTAVEMARVGWYLGNSGSLSHPVGEKPANPLGLYDMHGNVTEWCEDWEDLYRSEPASDPTGPDGGTYRVHRGGSWIQDAVNAHSYTRDSAPPRYAEHWIGFRLVSPLPEPSK